MGILFFLLLCLLCHDAAAYTLNSSQSIADGQTLISQNGTFVLGFFNFSNSNDRYVGIWYRTIPIQTIVWVANRDFPLNNTSGVLKIGAAGTIVVVNQTEGVVWSSNSSRSVDEPIIEFLDSGNLVLRDARDGNPENYLWQSFDHPGNTLLPGMKLGWNLTSGLDRYLSSWVNSNDPSPGGFTYGMEFNGHLESILRNGTRKFYRNGPWNGVSNSGAPDLRPNSVFTYELVQNEEEKYFIYHLVNQSVVMRIVLTQTSTEGQLQIFTFVERNNNWGLLVSVPRDRCDDYGLCGPHSTCDASNVVVCQCLQGFKPKSEADWSRTDWSQGCEREVSVNCTAGEGFRKYSGIKLPDTTIGTWVNASMNLEECRVSCLRNCSCTGYSVSDVREGGSGCIMWYTDLIDIRQLSESGQDLFIRMAASELDSEGNSGSNNRVIIIVSIASVAGVILLGLGSWCLWRKRNPKEGCLWWKRIPKDGKEGDDLESPLYDFLAISKATKNFSEENKLGEGGFGPVYRGKLDDGQEIAVKRLAKDSSQGVEEFKNEIVLISKLQHRNLVRLFGCCIQGDEKMLVYEYMPNSSLDFSLFDQTKGALLDWEKRFEVILGIARGLLYLHHDSRLRIIHRDLKASNILLDRDMIPKISDFGMARIFGGDQIEAQTKRVVGTYGYMSPEYAFDGHFSVKSDVFSFGVLVLEIISGKKNRGFSHPDNEVNLLGHAWKLWNEGKTMKLLDESIRDTGFVEEVERCIHIGLLCVQKKTELRPTMSTVVLMLSTESAVLPDPQLPGFYVDRSFPLNETTSSSGSKDFFSSSEASITTLIPR